MIGYIYTHTLNKVICLSLHVFNLNAHSNQNQQIIQLNKLSGKAFIRFFVVMYTPVFRLCLHIVGGGQGGWGPHVMQAIRIRDTGTGCPGNQPGQRFIIFEKIVPDIQLCFRLHLPGTTGSATPHLKNLAPPRWLSWQRYPATALQIWVTSVL